MFTTFQSLMLKSQADNLQNQDMTQTSLQQTAITQETPIDENQTTSKPINKKYIFSSSTTTFTNTTQHNHQFHHQHQQIYEVSPQGVNTYLNSISHPFYNHNAMSQVHRWGGSLQRQARQLKSPFNAPNKL